ncbi:MAG TPA: phenylalanine 4-monooxygenase, partial [Allosphingosinicella sp.]|nr:phenylalanine 4-monooxygenase [Allosphingosinicella sp.]
RVADVLQMLGVHGLEALASGNLHRLSRLYWYTIEFGLAREDGALKIYGAGLASSFGEAGFALEDPAVARHRFDLQRVLRTRYRSDAFQRCYYVIDGFDSLLDALERADLDRLYAAMEALPELDAG